MTKESRRESNLAAQARYRKTEKGKIAHQACSQRRLEKTKADRAELQELRTKIENGELNYVN